MTVLVALILIALGIGLVMVLGGLTVGTANAWFLSGNFVDGWDAAWDKPWVLLGFSILFFGILAGAFRND